MTRLEALREALPESIDAVLVTSNVNQRWLTGFNYTDGYVLVTRKVSYCICDFRYTEAALMEVNSGFEVTEFKGNYAAFIRKLLNDNSVKCVAYEDRVLTCADFTRISDWLSGFELVPAGGLIEGLRELKDTYEFDCIIKAQRIAESAFDHILGYITPDRTESDVALELEFFMRAHGAESTSFDTIAVSGSASSLPHGVPRRQKLERGFLTMDFGAKYKGYCSDMTRTIVIGRADDEMKRVYNTVLSAQTAAIEAAHTGVSLRDLDTVARDLINNAGFMGCFGHGLGHGVGMDIHEAPRVSQGAGEVVLSPGHVVTCEPGIYLAGKYGVRIEDMLFCDENGVRDITECPHELIELC